MFGFSPSPGRGGRPADGQACQRVCHMGASTGDVSQIRTAGAINKLVCIQDTVADVMCSTFILQVFFLVLAVSGYIAAISASIDSDDHSVPAVSPVTDVAHSADVLLAAFWKYPVHLMSLEMRSRRVYCRLEVAPGLTGQPLTQWTLDNEDEICSKRGRKLFSNMSTTTPLCRHVWPSSLLLQRKHFSLEYFSI